MEEAEKSIFLKGFLLGEELILPIKDSIFQNKYQNDSLFLVEEYESILKNPSLEIK